MTQQREFGALAGLPEALRLLFEKSGLSITSIAARAGVGRSSLHRFLSGEIVPSLPTLGCLLEVLGLDVVDLAEAVVKAQNGDGVGNDVPLHQEDLAPIEEALRLVRLRLKSGTLGDRPDSSKKTHSS